MARPRVQLLRAGGKTLPRIATETGIPLSIVRRIVVEPTIAAPRDLASALERDVGRPSVVDRSGCPGGRRCLRPMLLG